jgi:hypothetical protein
VAPRGCLKIPHVPASSELGTCVSDYTDETQLPIYEAIKGFPGFWSIHKYAHRFQAQRVKTWRKVAQRGAAATKGARTALSARRWRWGRNTRTRLSALRENHTPCRPAAFTLPRAAVKRAACLTGRLRTPSFVGTEVTRL